MNDMASFSFGWAAGEQIANGVPDDACSTAVLLGCA
jgi:hypothetical protein